MGRDVNKLVTKVAGALRSRGQTVGFAESCTGGLLSSMMAAMPGVSDVYNGAIVSYANHVKQTLLGVPVSQLRTFGAVSVPVARSMVNGARAVLGVDWCVSITGISGPGGGSVAKPVGTVVFGVSGPGVDKVVQEHFTGSRGVVQKASAEHALRLLLEELGESESGS
ncbi:MAG: CinA family protein [Bdellovibrionota bacterium]